MCTRSVCLFHIAVRLVRITMHRGHGLGHATIAFCVVSFHSFFIHSKPKLKPVDESCVCACFLSFSINLAFWNATPPHAEHLIMPSI